jgi:hypothetical protein
MDLVGHSDNELFINVIESASSSSNRNGTRHIVTDLIPFLSNSSRILSKSPWLAIIFGVIKMEPVWCFKTPSPVIGEVDEGETSKGGVICGPDGFVIDSWVRVVGGLRVLPVSLSSLAWLGGRLE